MIQILQAGQVLGKSTDNLEGYSLPDKGYFGPRRLPQFNVEFFDMPSGRVEDNLLDEFKENLHRLEGGQEADGTQLWEEFRQKMEEAVNRPSGDPEIGMDSESW